MRRDQSHETSESDQTFLSQFSSFTKLKLMNHCEYSDIRKMLGNETIQIV